MENGEFGEGFEKDPDEEEEPVFEPEGAFSPIFQLN